MHQNFLLFGSFFGLLQRFRRSSSIVAPFGFFFTPLERRDRGASNGVICF